MNHQNCRELLDSLSDYVDGSLSEVLCEEIERHMEGCENCRIVVDSLRKTVYLYHTTAATVPDMPDDVRERLYRRLELEEYLHKSK